MEICTIGTSGIAAERFFRTLSEAQVTSVIDTRLHPSSQLAGYAKQDSLRYFLDKILGVGYYHEPLLTPTDVKLKEYRSKSISWENYSGEYLAKLKDSKLESKLDITKWGAKPVLLCSETTAEFCHRRLAAEYLQKVFPQVNQINHLGN